MIRFNSPIQSFPAAARALAAGLLAASAMPPVHAKTAASAEVVRQLAQKLAERDAVIADLQKRVAQLEQNAGPTAARLPPAGGQAPAPGSAPPPRSKSPPRAKPAPGSFDVDEDDAERALERTLTQVGALLLPFGQAEIQPSFTYTRSEQQAPVVMASPGAHGVNLASEDVRRNEYTGGLFTRVGLPIDSQLEVGLPYRVVNQSVVDSGAGVSMATEHTASALGDVSAGLAKTFLREHGWMPDAIGRITWNTGTGKIASGGIVMGDGFDRLRGSVTLLKRQDPLAFTGQFFYEGAFEHGHIEPGDRYGVSIGAWLAASPETSLSVELQQTFANRLKVNGQSVPGSDQVASLLVFGGSSRLGRALTVSLFGGIGLTKHAPDYFVSLSLPLRFDKIP